MTEDNLLCEAAAALKRLIRDHPAFRSMPVGAPGSNARARQEDAIAAEDHARAVLAKIEALTKAN